jgi:hypothetical protein
VFAGHGVSGKDEYLIVCRNSGTYLSSASEPSRPSLFVSLGHTRLTGNFLEDLKDGACTGNTLPTRDNRIRWNVIPTRNGTGCYWYVRGLCYYRHVC